MPGKNTQAQPNVLLREASLRRERKKLGLEREGARDDTA